MSRLLCKRDIHLISQDACARSKCHFHTYVHFCCRAGVYDEKVLVGLDYAIHEASKRGIRVVPVFANYWAMYGGIDQYNTWSFEAGSGETPGCSYPLVLLQEALQMCCVCHLC